jgi:polysaccharide biosynthesis/export protein
MRSPYVLTLLLTIALVLACISAGAAAPALPSATRIHAGDQLSIQVYGDATLTQNVTVLPDGTVTYPLIGRVALAGSTPDQAAGILTKKLRRYILNPSVNVIIAQLGQPSVLVLGDVKTPGKYQLRSDAKLTDAIAAAGGLVNTNGAFPEARIADENGVVTKVSLEQLLQRGDTALDMGLSEGAVVYVPGRVQFAIAKAGNSQNAQSDLNHIRLIRTAPNGTETTTEINLYEAINEGNQSVDVALQKGDVIYVPQSAKHSGIAGVAGGIFDILTRLVIP